MARSIVLAMVATFAMLATVPAPVAPAGIPTPLETVIENGTFVITQPLVVGPGQTLIIRNAHVWLDWVGPSCAGSTGDDNCIGTIDVEGGTLRIENSTIDTHVVPYTYNQYQQPWFVKCRHGVVEVSDSVLRNVSRIECMFAGARPSVVQNSHFQGGLFGVKPRRGAEFVVDGNTFEDLHFGVYVFDAPITVTDNVFRRVSQNAMTFEMTIVGEKLYETRAVAERNLVEDSGTALLSKTGFEGTVYRDNVLRNNARGLMFGLALGDDMVHFESPLIERNTLDGNGIAFYLYLSKVSSDAKIPRTVSIVARDNAIVGTTCTEVLSKSERVPANHQFDFDLRGNWWGSADGPQAKGADCPATKGPHILVGPWLTEAPAWMA